MPDFPSQKYSKVYDLEDVESEISLHESDGFLSQLKQHWKADRCFRLTGIWTFGCLILMSVLITATVYLPQTQASHQPKPQNHKHLHCGNSTTEAIAFGCEFDLLSYSWTPPPCLDRETSNDFKTWLMSKDRLVSSWPFFADRNGKEWIANETALSMRDGLTTWTTQEEHLGHCIFLMRRIHKVAAHEAKFNSRQGNWGHTVHCTKQILEGLSGPSVKEQTQLRSYFGVSFESC